jgi:hypothetical protein
MALATKLACGAKMPQIARCSQNSIVWTFFNTLVEVTGIVLTLAELNSDRHKSPSKLPRR